MKMAASPRKRAKISDDKRDLVLAWHAMGKSFSEISSGLSIARSTAHSIIMKAAEDAPPRNPYGRPKKMDDDEHREFVRDLLQEDCTRTLAFIQAACFVRFEETYSLSTICRFLDEFHYSFKHVTKVDEHGETPENQERRVAYARDFLGRFSIDQTNLFYMDEVGFNVSMRRAYGYSPRGTRATIAVPHIRSKNLTVMALVGLPRGDPPSKVLVCPSLIFTLQKQNNDNESSHHRFGRCCLVQGMQTSAMRSSVKFCRCSAKWGSHREQLFSTM